MTTLRKFLLAALLLVMLGFWLIDDIGRQLHGPLPLSQAQSFEIDPGESFTTSLANMRAQALLPNARTALYLRLYVRWHDYGSRIQSGEYALEPGMSAVDAVALFMSGKTVLHELRIVEGSTFMQALQQIAAEPLLRHTLSELSAEQVMAAIGQHGQPAEGRFFPDTYRFTKNTTDISMLRRAYATMQNVLAAEWQTRAENLPYANADEALIMASIVEKETGAPAERTQVAGVFVRRLQTGMLLQTDPTVIYGMGAAFDGNLRLVDLRTDTPYNTYRRPGLPPTPICLPGRASINAALHPDSSKAIFFVSRGNGTHQFSETLEQHNAAVREFQLKKKP